MGYVGRDRKKQERGDLHGREKGEVNFAGLAADEFIARVDPLVDLALDGLFKLAVVWANLVGPLGVEAEEVGQAEGLASELLGDGVYRRRGLGRGHCLTQRGGYDGFHCISRCSVGVYKEREGAVSMCESSDALKALSGGLLAPLSCYFLTNTYPQKIP